MPVVKRALEYAERLQRSRRWQKTTHSFSSTLPLQVYTVLPNARAQLAGETPGTVEFDLQADETWFVYCLPAVRPSQIPTLVADADRDGVPRLVLHTAKSLDPVALSQLAGIGSLRGLSLPRDQARVSARLGFSAWRDVSAFAGYSGSFSNTAISHAAMIGLTLAF